MQESPAPGTLLPDASATWRKWAEPAVGLGLLAVAAWVLHRELEQVSYADLVAALRALPLRAELLALALMAANYLVMTGFDLLAFAYIGKRMAAWRVMTVSFVGYSISNNVGFTLLSGTSARYRFYSRWGLTPGDLSRVVVFYTGTFWVGLLLLGGWWLAFHSQAALGGDSRAVLLRVVGAGLLLGAAAYAIAPFFRTAPIRLGRFVVPIPSPRLVLGQYLLSSADWVLAASIFYALLPPGGPGFGQVLGAFLGAQLLAMVSHVPGGLGVFEGSMLFLLGAQVPADRLLGALILFRITYYLIPLALALLVLLGDEVRQRRQQVRRLGSAFGSLGPEVAPKLVGVFLFLAGAVLLLSGVRPVEPQRVEALLVVVPLAVLEVAQVLGSVVGVGLLVVSHGVGRRLGRAYPVAVALLAAGIAAALLKGGDYEEAVFLAGVLGMLILVRHHFDRPRLFWQARFSAGWNLAAVLVVLASIWIGLLANRHVEYHAALWWQVDVYGDAARFLRGSAAALLALAGFAVARRLRPRPVEMPVPTVAEARRAVTIIERSADGLPGVIGGRRTALLWSEARDACLAYTVRGRSWIGLGDPLGSEAGAAELVRRFVERADDFAARPVFLLASADRMNRYTDFGLTHIQVGEELRLPLAGDRRADADPASSPDCNNCPGSERFAFHVHDGEDADGPARKRDGADGDLLEAELLGRARSAVLSYEGEALATVRIWLRPAESEVLAGRLDRHGELSERAIESLIAHLVEWSRRHGFAWLNLGVRPVGPLESLASPFLAAGVAGLAATGSGGASDPSGTLQPERRPRFLAYPGGLALQPLLADIAALLRDSDG
jgi:phosphatidylglycerol lysyltransferase